MPMPNNTGMYVVDCDASSTSLGAVCQQWQDGRLKVIEYASRTLSKPERDYCVTRKEMSAMIFTLKQFRPYLLGRPFICRVDHQALEYVMTL